MIQLLLINKILRIEKLLLLNIYIKYKLFKLLAQ